MYKIDRSAGLHPLGEGPLDNMSRLNRAVTGVSTAARPPDPTLSGFLFGGLQGMFTPKPSQAMMASIYQPFRPQAGMSDLARFYQNGIQQARSAGPAGYQNSTKLQQLIPLLGPMALQYVMQS